MTDSSGGPDRPWRQSTWVRRDRRRLLAGIAVFVLLPVAGFYAGRRSQTEAESIAAAMPPPQAPITAPVESRVLESAQAFRGVVFVRTAELVVSPSDGAAVVTNPVSPDGTTLGEGDVLIGLDDRPVIVLKGQLPLLEDVPPGATGSAVTQLQNALARLDLYTGEIDGIYGPATQQAVEDLYERSSFVPPHRVGTDELLAAQEQLALARDEVEAARTNLSDALTDGQSGAGEQAALARAERALDAARSDLRRAQKAEGTPVRADEIMFVANLPARLIGSVAERGMVIREPTAVTSVQLSSPQVAVGLRSEEATLFTQGTEVAIELDSESIEADVTFVGEVTTGPIPPDILTTDLGALLQPNARLPLTSVGKSVRVLTTGSVNPEPVLAVPFSALRTEPDGSFYVLVLEEDRESRIAVEVGAEGDGFVEIASSRPPLAEGAAVVVGHQAGDG